MDSGANSADRCPSAKLRHGGGGGAAADGTGALSAMCIINGARVGNSLNGCFRLRVLRWEQCRCKRWNVRPNSLAVHAALKRNWQHAGLDVSFR